MKITIKEYEIEGTPEEIAEIIGINNSSLIEDSNYNIPLACRSCPNHPSNGGSGFCNCILGLKTFY